MGYLAADGKVPDEPLMRMEIKSNSSEKHSTGDTDETPKKDTKWFVFKPKSWLEVALPLLFKGSQKFTDFRHVNGQTDFFVERAGNLS